MTQKNQQKHLTKPKEQLKGREIREALAYKLGDGLGEIIEDEKEAQEEDGLFDSPDDKEEEGDWPEENSRSRQAIDGEERKREEDKITISLLIDGDIIVPQPELARKLDLAGSGSKYIPIINLLVDIANVIVEKNKDFFLGKVDAGINKLSTKEIIRESTKYELKVRDDEISRIKNNTRIKMPDGRFIPLKEFILSLKRGRINTINEQKVIQIINTEDKSNPYSDEEIADILISRLTPSVRKRIKKESVRVMVCRIRKKYGIPNKEERKKNGSAVGT
jgi:hypothetical protein